MAGAKRGRPSDTRATCKTGIRTQAARGPIFFLIISACYSEILRKIVIEADSPVDISPKMYRKNIYWIFCTSQKIDFSVGFYAFCLEKHSFLAILYCNAEQPSRTYLKHGFRQDLAKANPSEQQCRAIFLGRVLNATLAEIY